MPKTQGIPARGRGCNAKARPPGRAEQAGGDRSRLITCMMDTHVCLTVLGFLTARDRLLHQNEHVHFCNLTARL